MLKQYLLSPICLKCGSFFCDDSFFCKVCFQTEIGPRICLQPQSHLVNFRHYYLLEWNKNEGDVLNQMVYRLKSDNAKRAWNFYAELFYRNFKNQIDFKNYRALIPVPSAKQNSVHAKIFAHELSRLSALPVLDILTKKTRSSEQKTLSAEQRRQEAGIELKSPSDVHFTKCIFVDDVLTTGQSFLQSNRAINDSNENIIATLFYRPKTQ